MSAFTINDNTLKMLRCIRDQQPVWNDYVVKTTNSSWKQVQNKFKELMRFGFLTELGQEEGTYSELGHPPRVLYEITPTGYAFIKLLIGEHIDLDKEINHPPHYNWHPLIECIEVSKYYGFAVGNAIKYVWRQGHKLDSKSDLLKALWYLNLERDLLGNMDYYNRKIAFFDSPYHTGHEVFNKVVGHSIEEICLHFHNGSGAVMRGMLALEVANINRFAMLRATIEELEELIRNE